MRSRLPQPSLTFTVAQSLGPSPFPRAIWAALSHYPWICARCAQLRAQWLPRRFPASRNSAGQVLSLGRRRSPALRTIRCTAEHGSQRRPAVAIVVSPREPFLRCARACQVPPRAHSPARSGVAVGDLTVGAGRHRASPVQRATLRHPPASLPFTPQVSGGSHLFPRGRPCRSAPKEHLAPGTPGSSPHATGAPTSAGSLTARRSQGTAGAGCPRPERMPAEQGPGGRAVAPPSPGEVGRVRAHGHPKNLKGGE